MKYIGAAAALLFIGTIVVSGKLSPSLSAVRNHLERKVEYFSGRSARTELHHASSANTWGGRMATFNVSTTAQLSAALASAHAGDTILLASGIYSGVVLKNLNFNSPVTVTSADSAHPAKLLDMIVKDSSGLNISNLELDASSSTANYAFQVLSSSHINLSHLWVHGSLDGNPSDDLSPMMIRNSSFVTLSSSEFEQAINALSFLDNDHLVISGNSFHDLQTDAIHGGGSSYVTVAGNSFTDFYPAAGDHPDAIQFWTTGTTASAHDIIVTDNVITRGNGGIVQGIFLRDQVGTLPYINVTISGNMLVGTMFNGIDVQGGQNVGISNNIVAGLPDMKSWIRIDNVDGATLNHNVAGTLIEHSDSNVTITDFQTLLPTLDQANQLLQQWLSTHSDVAGIYHNELMWMISGSAAVGTAPDPTGTTSGGTTNTTGGGTTGGATTGSTTGSTSGGTGTTDIGNAASDSPRHLPSFETKIPFDQASGTESSAISPATDNIATSTNAVQTTQAVSHSTSDDFLWSAGGHAASAASSTPVLAPLSHDAVAVEPFQVASNVSTFMAVPIVSSMDHMQVVHVPEHLFW